MPRPDSLVSRIATPLSYPMYPYILALTADKRRGSLTRYPTDRVLANQSLCSPFRCLSQNFDHLTPISINLKGFAINKKGKIKTRLSGALLLVSAI